MQISGKQALGFCYFSGGRSGEVAWMICQTVNSLSEEDVLTVISGIIGFPFVISIHIYCR